MLCVAEKGTGFEWKNNDWVQAMYEPYAYILSKLDRDKDCSSVRSTERENFARPINPVSSWQGKSAGCYRLKEVGEKEGGIGYSCDKSWKRRDEGYVLHYVKCDGGLNYYMAAVDGPFALTRTYSIFWDRKERRRRI